MTENIKIGDLIVSDTGACGIVVGLPDKDPYQFNYIIYWNSGELGSQTVNKTNLARLLQFHKWTVISI